MGVPQGSVLGPLIFSLYINDLPFFIKDGELLLYADDTSIVVSARTEYELISKLESAADQFKAWCDNNKLIVNVNKTTCLKFSNTIHNNISFKFNNVLINSLNNTKFLGVLVDSLFNWKKHAEFILNKLNSAYFAILQLRSLLNKNALISIYYSLVYTYLTYGVFLWGDSVYSNRIFLAQKRIIRLIFRLKGTETCKLVFKTYKLLTLPSIYIYKCLIFFKLNQHNVNQFHQVHDHQTRFSYLHVLDHHRLSKYEKSPRYSGTIFFNMLPKEIQCLDFAVFKSKIKKILCNKAYYSVNEFLIDKLLLSH